MKCANCTAPAVYDYVGIKYCAKHLPLFIKNGKSVIQATKIEQAVVSQPVARPVEGLPVPVWEEKPAPKPKAKPKAKVAPQEN